MAKYYFQIEKIKIRQGKNGFTPEFEPVGKPSKTYSTINDVRLAARKYLIEHDLNLRYTKMSATIIKDGKEIDSLTYEGGEVESSGYNKRVNDVGKLVPRLKWY